jgi:hypothetical protein
MANLTYPQLRKFFEWLKGDGACPSCRTNAWIVQTGDQSELVPLKLGGSQAAGEPTPQRIDAIVLTCRFYDHATVEKRAKEYGWN